MINKKKADEILNSIPDPAQRKAIADILKGKIIKRVKCLSDKCDGRVIAHIYDDGRITATIDSGRMYLAASRKRLDGYIGFQCLCGNDSRLAEHEMGVEGIEMNAITKDDVEKVWDKLQSQPANYPIIKGKQIVDNFLIEEI